MNHRGYDVVIGGLLTALALILPLFFHLIGLGSSFLPMFIPIALAGFLTSFSVAATVGFLSPLISSLLTGMPPLYPPVAPIMMMEGLVLAVACGFFSQKLRFNPWVSLALALALDRAVLFLAVIVAARVMTLPPGVLGIASVLQGIPGIVLMMILIPPLVKKLQKQKQLASLYE